MGGYRLIRPRGEDALGPSWLAEDEHLARTVVLRFLYPEFSQDETAVQAFRREAGAASRMRHAAFVRTLETGQEHGHVWAVQDHVPGEMPLEDWLDKNPLPSRPSSRAKFAANLIHPLAEALHSAHEAGVIHRSVHPRNILLNDRGQARLGGFGLAMVADHMEWSGPSGTTEFSLTQTSGGKKSPTRRVARPYYASPEQILANRKGIDLRTDVWSLGVVLFELSAGSRPYTGTTVDDVLRAVQSADPFASPAGKSLGAEMRAICAKALSRDRDQRYANLQQMADDLDALQRGRPLLHSSEGGGRRLFKRLGIAGVSAIAAAIPLAILAPGWLANPQGRGEQIEAMKELVAARDRGEVVGELPRLFLLTLSVGEYDRDDLDLKAPHRDADAIVEAFQAQLGRAFREIKIRALKDQQVTKTAVSLARDNFLHAAAEKDTIVVYVAGHGVLSPNTREYWFLTPDATPEVPNYGVNRRDLDDLVLSENLVSSRRVLFYDTCASGSGLAEGARGGENPFGSLIDEDTVLRNRVLSSGHGIHIFAASARSGQAEELPGNGIFTAGVVSALTNTTAADANNDGVVDIDELFNHVEDHVMERTDNRQRPERVMSESSGGDLVLATRPLQEV